MLEKGRTNAVEYCGGMVEPGLLCCLEQTSGARIGLGCTCMSWDWTQNWDTTHVLNRCKVTQDLHVAPFDTQHAHRVICMDANYFPCISSIK